MATTAKTTTTMRRTHDDALSITDMLMICLRHWPWFILSLIICGGLATLYLLSTPKQYTRTMSILVKSGGTTKSEEMQVFEELGVTGLTSEISDEIVAIHSPAAIYDMVKRLRLDVSYYRPGYFCDEPLYAATLPVEVEFHELEDNALASCTLKLNGDSTATLTDLKLRGEEVGNDLKVGIGKRYKTPFGAITVTPTIYYNNSSRAEILVRREGLVAAAHRYGAMVSAHLQNGTKNIIDVVCTDKSIPRAENILKTIVNIYNENWVQNRNQISVSTNEFIKERLAVIEEELGDVDQNIASYKSEHAMPSVEAVAAQAMGLESAADQERQALSNQLYMVRYVRNYVTDPTHSMQLLPASSGIGNGAVEAQIAAYNEKLLQRNNLVANSSEQNPLVGDLDNALNELRGAIVNSLDNAQTTLNAQLSTVQAVRSQAIGRLSANPQQANHLLSIERQQKVKESLYLFLLQKREENELSQAFSAYNTRIIADPYGSNVPTSPVRNKIALIALFFALGIPAAFFIIRENMNTKVRGRKDLENLTIPYVGELPLWKPKKGERVDDDGYRFVVRRHSRDITNEAYRVVRTNLEFMTNQEKKCKVIMLTSFNPGSGKTFITGNLGASFGIRGSRVICIDLDLRRGSLSEFVDSPKKGLTNYLSGQLERYDDLIVHKALATKESTNKATEDDKAQAEVPMIDILPIGKIPPNPTELLYSSRLKTMIDELRQHYDYIFVDCPPVEIVADATIISREADVTIFVVRAGLLERSMLPELQKNYEEKKYNNMAILLNGTDAEHHYGYHRYGYGYGRYGYGKRYGYGYYGSNKKKK